MAFRKPPQTNQHSVNSVFPQRRESMGVFTQPAYYSMKAESPAPSLPPKSAGTPCENLLVEQKFMLPPASEYHIYPLSPAASGTDSDTEEAPEVQNMFQPVPQRVSYPQMNAPNQQFRPRSFVPPSSLPNSVPIQPMPIQQVPVPVQVPIQQVPMTVPIQMQPVPIQKQMQRLTIQIPPQPLQDSVPTFGALTRKKTTNMDKLRPIFNGQTSDQLKENASKPKKPVAPQSLLSDIELYRKAARHSDNLDIQFEFAKFCIESADSVDDQKLKKQLIQEGFDLLKETSSLNHVESQYYLGQAFAHDLEYYKAYNQFMIAAKRDHAPSCFAAGQALEKGLGCKKAPKLALSLYRKAAVAGHQPSLFRLGLAYLQGELGLKKNSGEAIKLLKRCAAVANETCPESLYQLHLIYESGIDSIKADQTYSLNTLVHASELQYPPAIYKLGQLYERGRLVQRNPQKSRALIEKAAESDYPEAIYHLSLLHGNEYQTVELALKAAKMGHADAMYRMGTFYETGKFMQPNKVEATEWFIKAAGHGSQQAQRRLGQTVYSNERPEPKKSECIIS